MTMIAKTVAPNRAPRWFLNWSQTSRHWLRGGRSIWVASAMCGAAAGAMAAADSAAGVWLRSSVIADPWVEDAVEHVRDQVEQDDQDREDEDERLHHRQIVGVDRRDQELPDPVHLEHLFRDDRAAEDRRHAERDDGDDGNERVPQHVDEDDDTLGQALGAGGSDVVLVQVVEHRGAHEARELRGDLER